MKSNLNKKIILKYIKHKSDASKVYSEHCMSLSDFFIVFMVKNHNKD